DRREKRFPAKPPSRHPDCAINQVSPCKLSGDTAKQAPRKRLAPPIGTFVPTPSRLTPQSSYPFDARSQIFIQSHPTLITKPCIFREFTYNHVVFIDNYP